MQTAVGPVPCPFIAGSPPVEDTTTETHATPTSRSAHSNMMAMSFRPHMDISLPWKGATKRPTTPNTHAPEEEVEPTGDNSANHTLLKKNDPSSNNDSDNETESATSTDKDTAAPMRPGVASSFARAGKLLWGSNPLSGLAALKKQHSRTVTDFSEADFTTPFTPGTPVWTRYGLGTIVMTRSDDGFLIVNLQNQSRMTLFLNPADEDYYSVPAIRHDWVETPAGEGRVVSFESKTQSYCVRVGGDGGARIDADVNVHRSDLRRIMPVRRQTQAVAPPKRVVAPTPAATPSVSHPFASEPSVISKGLNTAFKTIVTTSSGLSTSTYQFMSNYYYQGQCVVTTYGAGTIVSLDQNHHCAQVQLMWGAVAFLRTETILYYTKALVGMDVTTKFGAGVVVELRAAESMYGVQLHAAKDGGDAEVVYVHESDLTRGNSGGRRLRLGSAQKQISEKLGASTTKLFSFAQNKVKLFGHGNNAKTPAAATTATPSSTTDSPASTTTPARRSSSSSASPTIPAAAVVRPSRSKSTRVVENDDEVSSAGI